MLISFIIDIEMAISIRLMKNQPLFPDYIYVYKKIKIEMHILTFSLFINISDIYSIEI